MIPATSESEKVRFRTLNKNTGNRVVSQYVDSITGKAVREDDDVRGYARGENDYVILSDEDLDAVALDTVKTIDIDKFVPADSIGAQQKAMGINCDIALGLVAKVAKNPVLDVSVAARETHRHFRF
jgi:non-homologous end joining protein Ku